MKALTVDDSRMIRRVLRKQLEPLGFSVEEAENGRVALENLEKLWPVDVALVDWNMPEMDGLELVKQIRQERRYESIKIIMVTTESEADRITNALLAGANEYLMKPFDASALHQTLKLVGFGGNGWT